MVWPVQKVSRDNKTIITNWHSAYNFLPPNLDSLKSMQKMMQLNMAPHIPYALFLYQYAYHLGTTNTMVKILLSKTNDHLLIFFFTDFRASEQTWNTETAKVPELAFADFRRRCSPYETIRKQIRSSPSGIVVA